MRALCFSRASASVSSWPLVVGSLNSGARSPTCSTKESLSALEYVPTGARHPRDSVAGVERGGHRLPHGHPPRSRQLGSVRRRATISSGAWHMTTRAEDDPVTGSLLGPTDRRLSILQRSRSSADGSWGRPAAAASACCESSRHLIRRRSDSSPALRPSLISPYKLTR